MGGSWAYMFEEKLGAGVGGWVLGWVEESKGENNNR